MLAVTHSCFTDKMFEILACLMASGQKSCPWVCEAFLGLTGPAAMPGQSETHIRKASKNVRIVHVPVTKFDRLP